MGDELATATIQSTMLGPLWARAKYTKLYPELLKDDQAGVILEKVKDLHPDYDFAFLDEFLDELLGLSFAIRARTFDDVIMTYIKDKPQASIVNLGCGLDTTFSRVDNGTILWYDLDLPDAIEYRRQLIPETDRSTCIPKSIFDFSWMKDVDFESDNGLLIFAGGLFAYFEEMEVSELFKTMVKHFPGGEIIFDSSSSRGNWLINRRFRKYGVTGIDHKFEAKNRNQIESWSNKLQIIDWFPFFSRVEKNSDWGVRTRLIMALNSMFSLAKFIHVRFLDAHRNQYL
ncbi:MAG: class I SAM-dependent methyltransferase [Candidatus Thorarchaeota archaeon]